MKCVYIIKIQDVWIGGVLEPSTLMTGRMGSQCNIACVYGDELDDGCDDGFDLIRRGNADGNRDGSDNGNANGNATESVVQINNSIFQE